MIRRLLLGLAAALAIFAPFVGSAQPTGDRIVVWRAGDGGERRAAVPADALAQFRSDRQAGLDQARRAAARRIEAAMSETLRPILADGEARTEAFVDWVFDWWTAYVLLGQTASRAAATAAIRPDAALRAAEQTLDARVGDAYRRLVLRPSSTDRRLRGAAMAADRAAADVLRAECGQALGDGQRFIATHGHRFEARATAADWRSINGAPPAAADVASTCLLLVPEPDEIALAAAPPTAAAALGGGPSGAFLSIRLVRPFVTTSATTALRLAIPAIGTAVVVGGLAVSSVAVGTGFDYVLNEIDESTHRRQVEAEVLGTVRAAAGAYEAEAAARHRRVVEETLRRLAAALPAEP